MSVSLPAALGTAVLALVAAAGCGDRERNEGLEHDATRSTGRPKSGRLNVHRDRRYAFTISYPSDFVLNGRPAKELADLEPRPAAAFLITSAAASSDIPDLEPADLEIRVFRDGRGGSLKTWLTSNGLLSAEGGGSAKPFQTSNVSGVEICASTMIAPGCSYFVRGRNWVYQLIPATVEGETMVRTFML